MLHNSLLNLLCVYDIILVIKRLEMGQCAIFLAEYQKHDGTVTGTGIKTTTGTETTGFIVRMQECCGLFSLEKYHVLPDNG